MAKNTISINVTESDMHLYYLTVYNCLIFEVEDGKPIPSPLTGREIAVYSEILKINYKCRSMDPETRAEYINSATVRKKIRSLVPDISINHYNNIILKLSRKFTITGKPLYSLGIIPEDFEVISNCSSLEFAFVKQPDTPKNEESRAQESNTETPLDLQLEAGIS